MKHGLHSQIEGPQMTIARILVTGASGGAHGATGNHVARMLLKRGVPVRAFVHRVDERSDSIRTLGAEIIDRLCGLTGTSRQTRARQSSQSGSDPSTVGVSAEDVARVAAGVLQSPLLANATVLPLVGDVVTIQEIMQAFGEALGEPVPYHNITDDQWIRGDTSGREIKVSKQTIKSPLTSNASVAKLPNRSA